MDKSFLKLPRLIQILFLFITVFNFVTVVFVRLSAFLRKPTLIHLLFLILAIITLCIFSWIDLVWCLLLHHLIFM